MHDTPPHRRASVAPARSLRLGIMLAALACGLALAPVALMGASGDDWVLRATPAQGEWSSVTYGHGLFVALAQGGSDSRVMTSPDAVNWTSRTPASVALWASVAYGDGRFVAVGSGPGTSDRVMTSTDGITWTARPAADDIVWRSVSYGNGMFVAVGGVATAGRVMTSTDGITWTPRALPGGPDTIIWRSITYGNGMFVAVGAGSGATSEDRIMTSTDGASWASRTVPAPLSNYYSVAQANGLFVAVGGGNNPNPSVISTSPDGVTWTARGLPSGTSGTSLRGVVGGGGQFVVVASAGPARILTSPDGITWGVRPAPVDNRWYSIAYADNVFVAVSQDGGGTQVMTSGDLFPAVPPAPVAEAGDGVATVTARQGTVGLGTGGPVATFTVTASPGGRSCTAAGPTSGSCTIDGLTNGTAYTFSATATNGAGTSAASPASAAITPSGPGATQVARLGGRTACVLGRCITTGAVPQGATRVTQQGVLVRRQARSLEVAMSAATTATGRCAIRTSGAGAAARRTYRCSIRLAAGPWNLTTEARSSQVAVARSVTRVVVRRTARAVVTG